MLGEGAVDGVGLGVLRVLSHQRWNHHVDHEGVVGPSGWLETSDTLWGWGRAREASGAGSVETHSTS